MAYEVLARKWRPRQFDDVVGQRHVTDTLKNAIASDRVAHAYLFVGPRGIGKTTIARILAKALNAEDGPTATPDDDSDICREIMAGRSMDVLEIDGASNTGVDHVRDLRDNVVYAPARCRFKIYIIDEVHMLSTGAFNALLKTLEEPPAHVKFIFATTEPQKIPATILSRCQRFDLRKIATKDIVAHLRAIAEKEQVAIDENALLAVARGAEGGMRDALSALDQLISFRGKDIKEDDVLSVFGLVARHTLEALSGAILDGDIAGGIQVVQELDQAGKDLQRLNLELLEHFRNILVTLHAGEQGVELDLTRDQAVALRKQAEGREPARVLRIVDILSDAENRMRYALSKRTLFEMALIRAARAASVVTLDEILRQVEELKASLGEAPRREESPPETERAPTSGRAISIEGGAPVKVPPKQAKQPAPKAQGEPIEVLTERWHELVDYVGRIVALAKGYLIDAKPLKMESDTLVIGFDPEFADNVEKIDLPRNVKAIRKAVSKIIGREVDVTFRVMDASSTLPGDIKMDKLSSSGQPRQEVNTEVSLNKAKTRQEWLRNDVVRETLEAFNGDIADIRE